MHPNSLRPLLPLLVPPSFRIIAHRGASAYAPENTAAAFELAREIGATEIEFDLQFSKDRAIAVCHDRVLDRYGYPGLKIADLDWAELKTLDMGSWFSPYRFCDEPMLCFDDLLRRFSGFDVLHAEIKEPAPGLADAILGALAAHDATDRTIVTSFHFDAVNEAKRLAPDMPTGWLVRAGEFTPDNVARAVDAGFDQICPPASEVTPAGIAEARKIIGEVRAHSVRGVADMLKVIEAGCRGMTINWPDWLVHEKAAPGTSAP
ncbi:MAG: glycerophosphodiester phosphodiesterase family protein [Alphaproteobacteria bacterium]|nr:glycerophosphodiester phosphodiesterase family protein [Alphaproteobacteria bacterium]